MHLAVSLNIAVATGQTGLTFAEIAGFVRKIEAAGVDMVIISDSWPSGEPSTSPFEATTLIAALATVTENIGLVASASTLAHQPYNLARRFASLDIISHGRVGWNATLRQNPLEAANFSRPAGIPNNDFRRRAEEFIGIVQGLWGGWDADALLFDQAGGRFHDPRKMHFLDHKGEFFSVRGPLNIARSPQDTPLLAMSGLARTDLDFAASVADVIAIEEPPSEGARATCDDLKKRALAAGRTLDALKVLTTVFAPDLTAARLEVWLGAESSDGLIFALPADRSAIDGFTDRILPELRRRDRARPAHGATLRSRLALGAGGAK
ncbi:LLM class flavin-dependent oxidoreductase [Mesorhizobium humile]|uniref:LLM class flavin-dependent oxidoreductase n=1 Tax=Mesorhizobium humile TaxID=3072313 RepID=A0ABU4YAI6_9HYPH|nr:MULTISPECIES: LLM class flavin-dependent oxidoreductase [unclassified Mesorhizobium]MDX8458550.1 LLM class flavin-dependent oxidoreductase [Mesorhizobium sp. VK2D]MDX8483962.1 LLM class flavin-dependent oxidoreductase [Mesorhizobium sp. VK2B]